MGCVFMGPMTTVTYVFNPLALAPPLLLTACSSNSVHQHSGPRPVCLFQSLNAAWEPLPAMTLIPIQCWWRCISSSRSDQRSQLQTGISHCLWEIYKSTVWYVKVNTFQNELAHPPTPKTNSFLCFLVNDQHYHLLGCWSQRVECYSPSFPSLTL